MPLTVVNAAEACEYRWPGTHRSRGRPGCDDAGLAGPAGAPEGGDQEPHGRGRAHPAPVAGVQGGGRTGCGRQKQPILVSLSAQSAKAQHVTCQGRAWGAPPASSSSQTNRSHARRARARPPAGPGRGDPLPSRRRRDAAAPVHAACRAVPPGLVPADSGGLEGGPCLEDRDARGHGGRGGRGVVAGAERGAGGGRWPAGTAARFHHVRPGVLHGSKLSHFDASWAQLPVRVRASARPPDSSPAGRPPSPPPARHRGAPGGPLPRHGLPQVHCAAPGALQARARHGSGDRRRRRRALRPRLADHAG